MGIIYQPTAEPSVSSTIYIFLREEGRGCLPLSGSSDSLFLSLSGLFPPCVALGARTRVVWLVESL